MTFFFRLLHDESRAHTHLVVAGDITLEAAPGFTNSQVLFPGASNEIPCGRQVCHAQG